MSWKDILATAVTAQTLTRAQSCLSKKTIYLLGAGGLDPSVPLGQSCDCSGFVAWSIGFPRELPLGSGQWFDTDVFWNGGEPYHADLFNQVAIPAAQPGDLMVYPHYGPENSQPGHISIIVQVDNQMPTQIIHCSHGNYVNFGDAIRMTGPDIFLIGNHPTRVMRINYPALLAFGDVAA